MIRFTSGRVGLSAALVVALSACGSDSSSSSGTGGANTPATLDLEAACALQCGCTIGAPGEGGSGSTNAGTGGVASCTSRCLDEVSAYLEKLEASGCADEYEAFLICATANATCEGGNVQQASTCVETADAATKCFAGAGGAGDGA